MPPARDAPVQDVEDEREGNQECRRVEMAAILSGEESHGLEEGPDAAEPVGDGEEIRQVKVADHREVRARRWRHAADPARRPRHGQASPAVPYRAAGRSLMDTRQWTRSSSGG